MAACWSCGFAPILQHCGVIDVRVHSSQPKANQARLRSTNSLGRPTHSSREDVHSSGSLDEALERVNTDGSRNRVVDRAED